MLRLPVVRHRPPLLALMAAALLTTVLAGPTTADPAASSDEGASAGAPAPAAPAAPAARKQVRKVAVRNPSFRQGTRHWTAAGRHDTIRPARDGRGPGSSVALSTNRPGPAELRPKNRLDLPDDTGRVRALAWVRTVGPATKVSIRIETPSRKPLASRAYRVRPQDGWRRIQVKHRARGASGRLSLAIVAPGLRGSTLLVDDVALTTVRPPVTPSASTWASGVSGDGAADGGFGNWRGAPTEIAGTWNDGFEAQKHQWTLLDGFEYSAWEGDLDVAVGGIFPDEQGDTWRAAAAGAYDARWAQVLTTMASAWADRPGTLYIRFAHEFNGDWYQWKVTGGHVEDFKQAWKRFRALQLAIMPDAELVFSPSGETSASLGLDWRDAFPGREYVDVMSVDYYNQYPFVDTAKEFAASMNSVDSEGAPRGLEAHRRFAEANDLPFAISEWSSNASMGDSGSFMREFRSWLETHGGAGPGQVLYEVLFNVSNYGEGQFQIAPTTRQPQAAKVYRQLW